MSRFYWNDDKALEFARVASGGAYGDYKGCHSIESKLKRFKQIKMNRDRKTNVWIIIDEETLKVVADCKGARKFNTEAEANEWASNHLGLWQCFHVHFLHPWIQHKV